MKYVKEFGIILIVSLVGELLNYFLPLPVPASIYGLVLMFLCLMLGVQPVERGHDLGGFGANQREQHFAFLDVVQALGEFVDVEQDCAHHIEILGIGLPGQSSGHAAHRRQHRRDRMVLVVDDAQGFVLHG